MKKIGTIFTALALFLGLCACTAAQSEAPGAETSQTPTWQEQYDLGVRYLSEGNYKEAILAFTAAIEIDPKQAPAYVGRGDAYVLSGEAEENLAAAKVDYEKAIELDGTNAEAYLGLADVYIRQGNYEKALKILRQGLKLTENNPNITGRISELEKELSKPEETLSYNSYGGTEFTQRSDYREVTELTSVEISWLETALDAVANFDETRLEQLVNQCMEETENQVFAFRTIWNGYKVEFFCNHNYYGTPCLNGEFRPKDATGYVFSVTIPGEPTGVEGSSYGTVNRLAACQCIDWQWNGTATIMDVDLSMGTDKVDISILSNGTVPMINSLRDGDYIQDYTYFTTVTTYSMGRTIACDGEVQEFDSTFWGICSGYDGPVDGNQFTLDALYW